jgi:hypothetical protein
MAGKTVEDAKVWTELSMELLRSEFGRLSERVSDLVNATKTKSPDWREALNKAVEEWAEFSAIAGATAETGKEIFEQLE